MTKNLALGSDNRLQDRFSVGITSKFDFCTCLVPLVLSCCTIRSIRENQLVHPSHSVQENPAILPNI